MRRRFTFLRLLAWVFGAQFVLYVVYFALAAASHGATDWFQTAVWTIYGRVGGLVLLPFVPETWAASGFCSCLARSSALCFTLSCLLHSS